MNIELKDYFAGKVLQGLIIQKPTISSVEHLVSMSYCIAEKMIEHKHKLINDRYVNISKQVDSKGISI